MKQRIGMMWLVYICLTGLPILATAETVYVTDTLRIGVRSTPDNNAVPVGVVISGMPLEYLSRSGDYIKVRNAEGVEGWIKEIHITRDKPVRDQLQVYMTQSQQYKQELEQKEQALKTVQDENGKLNSLVDDLKSQNDKLASELSALQAPQGKSYFWVWLILGFIAVAAGGFYGGMLWHRQYVTNRLGGLKF